MGINGDRKVNDRDNKRAKAREGRAGRRGAGSEYQLTLQTFACLNALAYALARRGGALRVGLTRDMGALALGVYFGDDYATEYVRPAEDIWEATQEIATAWLDDGLEGLASAISDLNLMEWIQPK